MNFKYVITAGTNPYENLALEESLLHFIDSDEAIVYLWQNHHTIVIGKHQEPFAELKVREFIKTGGKIARRNSGGGAVYHDLGNLNFSIICKERNKNKYDYRSLIREVLLNFGMETDYNGRNDLIIAGSKFCGNAAYITGDSILCQHGSILICTDIEMMGRFLTPDKEKLQRNRVSSVASRVINLSEINNQITVENFCRMFIDAFQMQPLHGYVQAKDLKRLIELYASEDWIFRGIK